MKTIFLSDSIDQEGPTEINHLRIARYREHSIVQVMLSSIDNLLFATCTQNAPAPFLEQCSYHCFFFH